MSDLSINWDNVLKEQAEEAAGAVLPETDYDVVVVKSEATRAGTGSPMIKLTCDVVGGPFDKKRLWTNIVLKSDSPGAMRMSIRKLAGLGITREWLAEQNPGVEQIAQALTGRTAVAAVKQREWKGEMRNDIDMFKLGADGAAPAPPVSSSPLPSPEAELKAAAPAPAPAPVPTPEPAVAPAAPEPTAPAAAPADVASGEKDPF